MNNKKIAGAALLCLTMAVPFGGMADETRVVTCGTLNLRESASTESAVLAKVGWGTEVNVQCVNDGWAKVSVFGKTGYMSAKYLGKAEKKDRIAYVATNSRGLNLRACPNGDILTSFPRGTQVTILSAKGEWSRVSVDGKTGYMLTRWLSDKKPASSATQKPQSTPVIGVATVNNPVATQVLFLREKPSIESMALAYFRNGKEVKLLEKAGDWYKVSVDGKTGYMMAKFLKVKADVAPSSAVVINPNGNSFVNFRKAASLNAGVIRTIPVGTSIKVLEKTTDWTKTEIDGVTGYVSTWFLKF